MHKKKREALRRARNKRQRYLRIENMALRVERALMGSPRCRNVIIETKDGDIDPNDLTGGISFVSHKCILPEWHLSPHKSRSGKTWPINEVKISGI